MKEEMTAEEMTVEEKAVKRIGDMEKILDKATARMDVLEKALADFDEVRQELRKLEAYYTDKAWRDDLALDEAGKLPEGLKRGVLSEDGIWNALERCRELSERVGNDS